MNLPQIFQYNGSQVRTVVKNGEPWFVAKDVCEVLEVGNPSQAVARLDEDEKGLISIDTLGGKQDLMCVSEPGLYDLVLTSKKPEAKPFKRWVKHEVLPSIRKTGSYTVGPAPSYMIDDPIGRAQRWIEEERNRQALEALTKQREEQLALQAPKVALYDTAMSAGNDFTMERVSKTIGYGRNKLFQFLRDIKILRNNNLPYQEYIDRGYFNVRQYSITHLTQGIENKTQTLVTARGMAYIHDQLVKHGKLPAVAG